MREYLAIILAGATLLSLAGCDKQEKNMHLIKLSFRDTPCEVYFFKSWSTYQHPVKPNDPLSYEEALAREGFYRAWMCKQNGTEQFTFFEGIENSVTEAKFSPPADNDSSRLRFYRFQEGQGPGAELSAAETIKQQSFYAVFPDHGDVLKLIEQSKGISYEYVYNAQGALEKTVITDFDGNVKEI